MTQPVAIEQSIAPPPGWIAQLLQRAALWRVQRWLAAAGAVEGLDYRVSSTYRDAARNQAVGGASNSAHVHGLAVDVVALPGSPLDYAAMAAAWNAQGLGYAHYDARHLHLGLARAWGVRVVQGASMAAAAALLLGVLHDA